MHTLADLKIGERAVITSIHPNASDAISQRLLDLGFVRGAGIFVETVSPLKDPVAYNIHNTLISLRRKDAEKVYIEKIFAKENK